MIFAPCNSFILISFLLCAEPIIKNFFKDEYERCLVFLLKEGMYAPSKFKLIASLTLFDKKNLYPFFLQYILIFKIRLSLVFRL